MQNESYSATKKNATAVLMYPAEQLKWEKLKISFFKMYENSYVLNLMFAGTSTEHLLNVFHKEFAPFLVSLTLIIICRYGCIIVSV